MNGRCDNCRKRLNGDGKRTATRVLCDDCFTQFTGLAAGFMTAGTVDDVISTGSWYARIRAATRRDD